MYPKWLWPAFALPGVIWLILLFLTPFYAVVGVAFGGVDPIFQNPVPAWNPLAAARNRLVLVNRDRGCVPMPACRSRCSGLVGRPPQVQLPAV